MHRKNVHIVVCTVLLCLCSNISAQKKITGPVNIYTTVSSKTNNNTITIGSAGGFAANDTVLLIQMTGTSWDGNLVGSAGLYEFHVIKAVSGNTATMKSNIIGDFFNPGNGELVQMIRVSTYKNAQVDQVLRCEPWNGQTGGVLALMVEGKLTLNADIDASECGFLGGAKNTNTVYGGECSVNAPYDARDYAAAESDRAGNKGQGVVSYPLYAAAPRGWGTTWNGGGGGNGKYSGGGGGGNGGNGGTADYQYCSYSLSGFPGSTGSDDIGGNAFKYGTQGWNGLQRAYMGGGGGSGTGDNTPGGNGGGIVIIIAGELQFNNGAAIKSNGGSVTGVAGLDTGLGGAGGGGGGGSILLSVGKYHNLAVEIKGGNGGSVYTEEPCSAVELLRGAGGGGGGGLLYVTDIGKMPLPRSVVNTQGAGGKISNERCSTRATDGNRTVAVSTLNGLSIRLRGFFYNYITTRDTTVCYGETKIIKASRPQGSDNAYTCQWWQSADGAAWTPIANGNTINYTAQNLSVTTYFRRTVSSFENSQPPTEVTDTSVPVKVAVVPEITNTLALTDTTVCGNVTALDIGGGAPSGGNGTYAYRWEQNMNGTGWADAASVAGTETKLTVSLQPGEQYYRRVVTSANCTVTSASAQIHILPVISGNILTPGEQQLCEGSAPGRLTDQTLAGGDNAYTYSWQTGDDNNTWTDIAGAESRTYQPPAPVITENVKRYYRRIVLSGAKTSGSYHCCRSVSEGAALHYYEPLPPVSAGDGKTLDFDFKTQLDAGSLVVAGSTGLWTVVEGSMDFQYPDRPSTEATGLQFGKNTARWTVSNGACPEVSSQVTITVVDVTIPSGFSPNGDNINDCFRLVGAENATSGELIIFNRYSNVVYRSDSFKGNSSDCSGWWDGSNDSGKELPSGIYFYQLTLNGNKVYKGYVVLKR